MANRYLEVMSRDELVEEVKGLVVGGVFAPHEVGDPTILPAVALRRRLKRLRMRILIEGRHGAHGAARAD